MENAYKEQRSGVMQKLLVLPFIGSLRTQMQFVTRGGWTTWMLGMVATSNWTTRCDAHFLFIDVQARTFCSICQLAACDNI